MGFLALAALLSMVINPLPHGDMAEGSRWRETDPSAKVERFGGGFRVSGTAELSLNDGMERSFRFGEGYYGRNYTATILVGGSGRARLGVLTTGSGSGTVNWSTPVVLGKEPHEIKVSGHVSDPACTGLRILLEVKDGTAAVARTRMKFDYDRAGELHIELAQEKDTSPPASSIAIPFAERGSPAIIAVPGEELNLNLIASGEIAVRIYASARTTEPASEQRVCPGAFSFNVPWNATGILRMVFGIDGDRVCRTLFVRIVSREDSEELNALAMSCDIREPRHILVIGDSLTDYHRGVNYIALADGLLRKHYPGMVSFRNVACGGDYITRVCGRLDAVSAGTTSYRAYMYENIFNPRPDTALVLLGANDTKASDDNDYRVALVPPAEQEKHYRRLIETLRGYGVRRIILFNCLSFDAARMEKIAAAARASGKRHNLFGVDARIREFNAVIDRLADEYKLEAVDLYGASLALPDKNTLFADGVHLSDKGQLFMTRQLLQILKQK